MSSLLLNYKRFLPDPVFDFMKAKKQYLLGKYYCNDLTKLAQLHLCDKWGTHFYTPHYDAHFKNFKNKDIKLLEIGVGGYKNPDRGGASLRMWKDYFRKGEIYAIDIHDKSLLEENRIKIFQGSQTDLEFLKRICSEVGELDLIIDDGSHMNNDIVKSFKYLFPKLKSGGVYVVEDLQCSYWPWYGGDSENLDNPLTAVNYFKSLIHGINHVEFLKPGYIPNYFEQNITSIHFYHNIIFIHKGDNTTPSSHLINNRLPK